MECVNLMYIFPPPSEDAFFLSEVGNMLKHKDIDTPFHLRAKSPKLADSIGIEGYNDAKLNIICDISKEVGRKAFK